MNIAFYNPIYSFPIPAVGGGAVEELEEILVDENEKNKKHKFIIFQPQLSKKKMQQIKKFNYSNTKLVFVKYSKVKMFFYRVLNKIRKVLKLKINNISPYEKAFLKALSKEKIDKLVFEGLCPDTILDKLKIKMGRNNLFVHVHSNYNITKQVSENVGNVIGVSNFVLNQWKDYAKVNDGKKLNYHLLLNCVRDSKFSQKLKDNERIKLRKSFGFNDDDVVLVFCGRILEIKGVRELIDAMLAIHDEKLKLLLVGSPNFSSKTKTEYLENVIKICNNNQNRIKFSGYVENSKVAKIYQSGDIQVVPSKYNDPAPLVVIEGLKCGMPQICTASGGIVEYTSKEGSIIVDKNENLTKNLHKAICQIYSNKNALNKMSKANIKQGLLFTTEKFYKDFCDILEVKNG